MPRDKAYLVIVKRAGMSETDWRESLEEIRELTESAGGIVVDFVRAPVERPRPSHFIREGKLLEIREKALTAGANVLIFNVELTPVQARNIESFTGLRPVDRTGLILDIFARRAVSHEGRLQVELAQLNYLLPRLVGQGVIMSRLGGGIGTRGPGEQKLEVDRRKIRQRIQHVKKDLEKLRRHRALLRAGRRQKNLIQAAIVGYTNAGKTTLLNALTGAHAYAAQKMFATLDPKTRIQRSAAQKILFTDTVGFLRDLPHHLVEAFHATLEEVTESDIVIHVLDASSAKAVEQKKVVEDVLHQIHADHKPTLLTLNKADLLTEEQKERTGDSFPEGHLISAARKEGLEGLLMKIQDITLLKAPNL